MLRQLRRYEVLLPRTFNDGRPVPPEWLAEAVQEIVDRYGDVSYETQTVEGHWRYQGSIYRDSLSKLVVDLPDSPEHREWMSGFKLRWQARLEQIELWMVSFVIALE
jgi:hypothetical protein